MRLFVALDIDDSIRNGITQFIDQMRPVAPEARWVRPESLHVTLKFIGEKSEEDAEKIKQILRRIVASAIEMHLAGYGFFPETRAPRVFWVGIKAGSELTGLAARIDEQLSTLGIPREQHPFHPHLTLARGGRGSGSPRWRKGDGPNRTFGLLQEKLETSTVPDFGTMTSREFCLYQSQLSPSGSKYVKLANFSLR